MQRLELYPVCNNLRRFYNFTIGEPYVPMCVSGWPGMHLPKFANLFLVLNAKKWPMLHGQFSLQYELEQCAL